MGTTATIRVPEKTRDRLAQIAAQRGTSIAKLISEFANHEHIHQIYAEERESWRRALDDPAFAEDLELFGEVDLDEFD